MIILFEILKKCPLFKEITPENIDLLLGYLNAQTKDYSRNDYILHAGDPPGLVGIVLTSAVHIIKEDYWGSRAILANICPGDIFAEAFACAEADILPVSVAAAEKSQILFINYKKIFTTTPAVSQLQNLLIKNMLQITARKNIILTRRMEHTGQKSIREKLMSYLSSLALEAGSNQIRLPFNRQELADYLGVDRSALSRELSRMQSDGLVKYHKEQFRLL